MDKSKYFSLVVCIVRDLGKKCVFIWKLQLDIVIAKAMNNVTGV